MSARIHPCKLWTGQERDGRDPTQSSGLTVLKETESGASIQVPVPARPPHTTVILNIHLPFIFSHCQFSLTLVNYEYRNKI